MNITEIKEANKAIDNHWFEADTLAFFKSEVYAEVYGQHFITSECGPDNIRKFSVRRANESGSISTVGGFQAYSTKEAAIDAAKEADCEEIR